MRDIHAAALVALCLSAVAVTSVSAASRKPGLWEFTTTTTWQKAPSAFEAPPDRFKNSTRTTQVCLTAEMIDQYGILLPHSRGQCSVEHKQVYPGRITADYVCDGTMTGTGALESKWSDPEHATGSLHFVGTLRLGPKVLPIEWTTLSSAVFRNADCGDVKPAALPQKAD